MLRETATASIWNKYLLVLYVNRAYSWWGGGHWTPVMAGKCAVHRATVKLWSMRALGQWEGVTATYERITYHHIQPTYAGPMAERIGGPSTPTTFWFFWLNVTFGIFTGELTTAVNYKMASCDSFTGIEAPFQIPDWLIPIAIPKPKKMCAAREEAPKWKPLAEVIQLEDMQWNTEGVD